MYVFKLVLMAYYCYLCFSVASLVLAVDFRYQTSATDCLERFVPGMTCNDSTHSITCYAVAKADSYVFVRVFFL